MENKRLKGVVQMGRVKPPFSYFGSKGRFYKEIKEIFINKNKWTDELSSLDSNSRKFTLDSRSKP